MRLYTIENEYQKLTFLDLGATIYKWIAYNDKTNIVLTNKNIEDYQSIKNGLVGSTVGRVANRIKNARFKIDNNEYFLEKNYAKIHHFHGGNRGLYQKVFSCEFHNNTKIVFKTTEEANENNYPGNLTLYVTYELFLNELKVSYHATSSEDTIVNITNHSYFNLGDSNILSHKLKVHSNEILETDDLLIPTGKTIIVNKTPLDFNEKKEVKDAIIDYQNQPTKGIDHYFLFSNYKELELSYKNKRIIVKTSYPGAQIYTHNYHFKQDIINYDNKNLYLGIAIEPQFEVDSINNKNFHSIILRKGETYNHYISYILKED